MPEIDHLIKNLALKPGQDWALLRSEGITHIEKLASRLWTDYNVHDPGITILEMLCYAITDLGYRTDFEIKDLLTRLVNGSDPDTGDFYTAAEILPSSAVSFDDLRKLLIDITGVRNAWVSKNTETSYCLDKAEQLLKDSCTKNTDEQLAPLNGLYDVLIQTEDNITDEPRLSYAAKKDNSGDGGYVAAGTKGIEFKVLYPFTLESVHVYAQNPGIANVRLLRRNESGVYQTVKSVSRDIPNADEKTEITTAFILDPGEYRLDANGSATSLFSNNSYDYSKVFPNLLHLQNGYSGSAKNARYYFFYDWKISLLVSPFAKELLDSGELFEAIGGLSEKDTGISGGFILPGGKGLQFNVYATLYLNTITVFPQTSGTIQVTISNGSGNTIYSQTFEVEAAPDDGVVLNVATKLDPGGGYEIKADGLVKLYRDTGVASFQAEPNPVLEIKTGIPTENYYFFFYHWEIEHYHPVPFTARLTLEEVMLAVEDTIYNHRNLCEDLMHIRELEREFIGVCADIEVSDDADIQQVMADIFFELEFYVSPPVIFYTIEELQKRGYTTDEIFEGPSLQHGFIDDAEFQKIQRTCYLRTSDIIQIIMDVAGVKAVKNISLLSYTEVTPENPVKPGDQVVTTDGIQFIVREEDWILELANPAKMAPDFDPEKSKIVFYKDGLPYLPNINKALDLYNERRSLMSSRKLIGIERDFSVPVGEFMDVEKHYPIQNDLPATYMVGSHRVPDSETDLRRAQSRQLKGYLMFFEQILANYFSQLGHIRELFNWKNGEIKTYFTQLVQGIPGIEDIYSWDETITDPGMAEQVLEQLNAIIESPKVAEERKNRFLDHLMGRFAEDFSEYSLLMYAVYKKAAAKKLIGDKRDFLNDYPLLSRDRGLGFDYRYPLTSENITGLQRRAGRLMGFDNVKRRNLAGSRLRIDRLESGEGESCPKDSWRFEYVDVENQVLFQSVCCESRDNICILLDAAILIGACIDNYRYDEVSGKWQLLNTCSEEEVIGDMVVDGDNALAEVQTYFAKLAGNEGFHVIEHILLRKRIEEDDFMPVQLNEPGTECTEACVEVKDPYSFRATVFLPAWPKRLQSIRFRRLIERTLRMEAPAHVYLKICWLSHCDMLSFEEIYNEWLAIFSKVGVEYKGKPDISLSDFTPGTEAHTLLTEHNEKLSKLIGKLHGVDNVQPLAALHDCLNPDSENPQITLNQMSLGSQ